MKLSEIEWRAGKTYKDENGKVWKVVYEDPDGLILKSTKGEILGDKVWLDYICDAELEEVEQKYYLRLDKPYEDDFSNYLNFSTVTKDRIIVSTRKDDKEWKTKFTKAEIKDLVDEFGNCILDFAFVPVEEIDG